MEESYGLIVNKSNELIYSKYKSDKLENKILAIAMARIEEQKTGENKGKLEARLYNGELRKLLGDPSGKHLYPKLKPVSQRMYGHPIVIEDGKGNFKTFAMVTNADYIDGVFIVRFNEELAPHLLDIKTRRGYTPLQLSVILNAKRNTTIKIYELLRSQIYRSKKDINDGMVEFKMDIYEFRFCIGVADISEPDVEVAISKMGNDIDWKYLYENVARFKVYDDYRLLKRKVLQPAQEELLEKADIRFEFEGERTVGNFFGNIVFYIYKNKPQKQAQKKISEKISELEKNGFYQTEFPRDFYEIYEKYEGHNYLSKDDINLLLKESHYDEELISKAINYVDGRPLIRNYMGALIDYIRSAVENGGLGYEERNTQVMDGSAEMAEKVNATMKEYEENREIIAKRTWEEVKAKPEFEEFEDYQRNMGYEIGALEEAFSPAELFTKYVEWKRKHKS